MRVGVLGYGHFANIVAVCLASKGHEIVQYDLEPHIIRAGQDMSKEPGYAERRAFYAEQFLDAPLSICELIWAAYDVPLNADGSSDEEVVITRISDIICGRIPRDAPFVISTQWTAGTTAALQRTWVWPNVAYVQENIRVGHGIEDFLDQSRCIVGCEPGFPDTLHSLLSAFTDKIIVVSPTSAEMGKHALNAFLALQIAFINEIARLAKLVGATPTDVSLALTTDARVSPKAPLTPGDPFSGGSLQRDVLTLNRLAHTCHIDTPILNAIIPSNVPR